MTAVLMITVLTCLGLITIVLVKPYITIHGKQYSIYWSVVLLGVCALLIGGYLTPREIFSGLTAHSAMNPIEILVLFISMTILSIYLDEVGFFRYMAVVTLRRARTNQLQLFVYLYLIVSILTVFTSNDIIILTFTPFICYFSKNAGINPVPFLFSEFVAANTWSMMLVIGNPTNVFLATAGNIDFIEYTGVMFLPTLAGGFMAMLMLFLVFRRQLSKPLTSSSESISLEDRPALIIGICHLGSCTVLLILSSYLKFSMWLISLCFAVSLFICVFLYKKITRQPITILRKCAARAPWELIPFVLSMFVLVLACSKYGITGHIADLLGEKNTVFHYGISSFLACNVMNNIPMSVLFSGITEHLPEVLARQGIFATIIGSNLGAFFTPLGALAGIMWTGILKKQEVKFSFLTFIWYGICISLPTLIVSLLVLQFTS